MRISDYFKINLHLSHFQSISILIINRKTLFYFQLILNAKCHAIRDAQILEKQQIKTELISEEQRLDAMMEADRVNAISVEEGIDHRRKQDCMIGAMKIMEQIQENEQVNCPPFCIFDFSVTNR